MGFDGGQWQLKTNAVASMDLAARFEAGAHNFTTVEGTPPLTFQWYLDCTNPIPAATQATLALTNVTLADGGNYCVVVSNAFGTVISQPAALRVLATPDFVSISRAGSVVSVRSPRFPACSTPFSTMTRLVPQVGYVCSTVSNGWEAACR